MKCPRPVFLMIAAFFLCSCATIDSATKQVASMGAEETSKAFYVGRSDLKLFPEPRFSKTVIAKLSLNEKVLRDRLEKGFAHVTVISTGQTGWVNNGYLVWRKPKASAPKPLPPKPTPTRKPPEENVIQESSRPHQEIEGRDASIFNAF
ncbi:MAG: hypothetical protein JRL30_09785 [Deltaproteobacteria bacterium]|nr:hypothetical protein [Deltaproteobacteria bacterium]